MAHYNAMYNFRFAVLKEKNVNLFATRAFASWLRSNIRVVPDEEDKEAYDQHYRFWKIYHTFQKLYYRSGGWNKVYQGVF